MPYKLPEVRRAYETHWRTERRAKKKAYEIANAPRNDVNDSCYISFDEDDGHVIGRKARRRMLAEQLKQLQSEIVRLRNINWQASSRQEDMQAPHRRDLAAA